MPIQNTSNVPPNYFVVKKNLEACPQPFGEESIMSTQRQSQRAECSLHTCGRGGFSQGAVVSPCILKKESDLVWGPFTARADFASCLPLAK